MLGVVILGSTGSIGTQTLDVIMSMPERFQVVGLAAGSNVDRLERQIREFKPTVASLADTAAANRLGSRGLEGTTILSGQRGILEMVQRDDVDIVLNAIVGAEGIRPTLAAIEAGKDIALANKETLVAAGSVIMAAVDRYGVRLLPVDSEHSAIFQCLQGANDKHLHKIILTASGGPFRQSSLEKLRQVSVSEALNHPTWDMGGKITIDSATLMNKGLEVIEAHWLFGVPGEQIDVVVHPQSIIHSLVELTDGSVLAQLGVADMRLPIQYALTYPERLPSSVAPLDLATIGKLEFEAPDTKRFPCLELAYDALKMGGTYPTVLNASNEVAVEAFVNGEIGFLDIPRLVRDALDNHQGVSSPSIHEILAADAAVRRDCATYLRQRRS
ncbi:MAG: 1-deoxy-D-xylulose-5-phosphate reductoisomerase [Firmicutes bacterium]|nr:1-deoxy-D-xylulose-5-phosphate reductoisomerase [Bacillota bacterium]